MSALGTHQSRRFARLSPARWVRAGKTTLLLLATLTLTLTLAPHLGVTASMDAGMDAGMVNKSIDHQGLIVSTSGLFIALVFLGLMYLRLRNTTRRAIEAEILLTTAIDSISDGFAIYDADDRLVMCNEQLRSMYPLLADHLAPGAQCADLARTLCEKIGITDEDELAQNIDKLTCGIGETEMQLDDGRWVLHRDRILPDGGKVGVRTDITEIKRREQFLLDNAAHYRDLVERSPAPILVHRGGVVLYANSATASILGYPQPDHIVGRNILTLIHPDHHKLSIRRTALAQEASAPLPKIDLKFIRFDGSTI